MKTIRTNCFETNSSSTHSFTVSAPTNLSLKPTQTFLADDDGIISVHLEAGDGDNSLKGKLTFLLATAYHMGNQAAYDRVVKVVEDFTKLTVKATVKAWTGEVWETNEVTSVLSHDNEEAMSEHIEDQYYSWVRDYGHGSVEDFIDKVNKSVESEQAILVFIFTNHLPFDSEAHYDG